MIVRIILLTADHIGLVTLEPAVREAFDRALDHRGASAAGEPMYVGIATEAVVVDGTPIDTQGMTLHAFELQAQIH